MRNFIKDVLDTEQCLFCRGPLHYFYQQERSAEEYIEARDFLQQARALLCAECLAQLPYRTDDWCQVAQTDIPLTLIFNYEDPLKRALRQFKFHGERSVARVLAIFAAYKLAQLDYYPSLLIPLPIHARRRAQRGYNQAEILAEELAELLGVRVETQLLWRQRDTEPQTEMSSLEARQQNVRGAFALRSEVWSSQLRGQKALLLDDVYTTGASLRAAALCLEEAELNLRCLCFAYQQPSRPNSQS